VSLVLDLRITHERFGSSPDPSINGHLHYLNDVDRSLNESDCDKIRKYRSDFNLCDFYFNKLIGKLTVFLQIQEFSWHIQTVDFSITTVCCSPPR
jgi:hypothetical protein